MTQSEFDESLAVEFAARLSIIYECEITFRKLLLTVMKIHMDAPSGSEMEKDALAMQTIIGVHRILLDSARSQIASDPRLEDVTAPTNRLH